MGIKKMKNIAEKFGKAWVMETFIPKIEETYNQEKLGFTYRVACLYSISAVMYQLEAIDISNKVMPFF